MSVHTTALHFIPNDHYLNYSIYLLIYAPEELSRHSDSLTESNPDSGERFSAPVQTGPGALLASYTMGTVLFLGVKLPGRGVDHIPPLPTSAEVD